MAPAELDRFLQLVNTTRPDRAAPRTGTEIVRFAAEHDIQLAPADLWSLTARSRSGDTVCPPSIANFIVQLLKGVQPERVLDPFVGLGTLLQPVLASTQASRFVGTYPNDDALQVAEWLQPIRGASEYRICDLQGEGLSGLGEFDLVVCLTPFGFRPRKFTLNGITMRDEGGVELLLRSSLLLAPQGLAIFVLPPRVHYAANQRSVIRRLPDFGLHLDASFHVPEGAFMPLTTTAANIVVIRRGPTPATLFAGQVNSEEQPLTALLSHYRKRQPGPTPELGVLVPPADFRGFETEISRYRVAGLTARLNFTRKELADYTLEIRRCPRNPNRIEHKDNAFFLPLIATSRCRTDVATLTTRPDGFLQVVVDPGKADSKVLAGFFDSPLGREIRLMSAFGATIPRVPPAVIPRLPVWLPDIEQQRTILKLDRRLRAISSEASELHSQLWQSPNRTNEVSRRLKRLNREETLKAWLQTLPFPLASALWTHHTLKGRPLKRYQQLEFFFEALVAFLAVWLMSGVRRSPDLFEVQWESIRKTLHGAGLSVGRATFGTWVAVFERLAKCVRPGVNGKEEDLHYWEANFACASPELLRSLVSKTLVNIAKKANRRRNDWHGHTGTISDAEAVRREAVLLELLADFRDLVGYRWGDYPLVLHNSLAFSRGVYRSGVSLVTGYATPFEHEQLNLQEALEEDRLHFVNPQSGAICKLLPLVRLGATGTEERNACYFFNRLEGRETQRYVSYHFEDRPDVIETVPAASELLRELSRRE